MVHDLRIIVFTFVVYGNSTMGSICYLCVVLSTPNIDLSNFKWRWSFEYKFGSPKRKITLVAGNDECFDPMEGSHHYYGQHRSQL